MKSTKLFDISQVELEKPEEGLEGFQEEFFQERLKELKRLQVLIDQGNFDEICAIAHSWKGYSKPYGFDALGEMAGILEKSSKAHDAKSSQDVIYNLEAYMNLKQNHLNLQI